MRDAALALALITLVAASMSRAQIADGPQADDYPIIAELYNDPARYSGRSSVIALPLRAGRADGAPKFTIRRLVVTSLGGTATCRSGHICLQKRGALPSLHLCLLGPGRRRVDNFADSKLKRINSAVFAFLHLHQNRSHQFVLTIGIKFDASIWHDQLIGRDIGLR
jgi:hypothetical protein